MTLRKGIKKVKDILKVEKRQACCEDVNFILTFPTGYGKTTLSLELANMISNSHTRNFARIIHVVPMRALVKDIEERAKREGLEYAVQYSFSPSEIKSPEFLAKFVITTYDSFLLNLYKASVGEPYRSHGHYDLPRFSIYTSLVHFDEFHLMNDDKSWTSLITAVRHLSRMGVNMILSSATPSWEIEKELIRMMENRKIVKLAIVNDFGQAVKKQDCKLKNTDHDIAYYECTVDSVEYKTIEIKENLEVPNIDIEFINGGIDEIISKVKENEGKRILIVANTVENAIKVYEKLKKKLNGLLICLLHSRFKIEDREEIFNNIGKEWKGEEKKSERGCDVIVSTQVIEVGVNLSAEVLITEQAPITSIVQRAGRLLRYDSEKDKQGKLYIWKSGNTNPYDKDEVEKTVNILEDLIIKNNKNVSLKLPYGDKNLIGYADIVDEIIKPPEVKVGLVLELEDIAENIFATKEDLDNLLDRYCNITRDSFIVNVATEIPQTEKDLTRIENYLIPLEGNLVNKVVVKDKNEKGKECIKAYVEEFYQDKTTETDEVKLNERCIEIKVNKKDKQNEDKTSNYLCKIYRKVHKDNKIKYIIYALKVNEEKYNKETGLRI